MAVQRHPVESFSKTLNFWEEFPDYKIHRVFGTLWKLNRKNNKLQQSSLFMWALSLCYDRKSAIFNQPESDKWEVVSEDLFEDKELMIKLAYEDKQTTIFLVPGVSLQEYISEFEKSIDTPLGMSLRDLERKLSERTAFITATKYKMDYYETIGGKTVIKKGTVDQLDRMFRDTDKINSLIQKAIDALKTSEQGGSAKGGGMESLGDGDNTF